MKSAYQIYFEVYCDSEKYAVTKNFETFEEAKKYYDEFECTPTNCKMLSERVKELETCKDVHSTMLCTFNLTMAMNPTKGECTFHKDFVLPKWWDAYKATGDRKLILLDDE